MAAITRPTQTTYTTRSLDDRLEKAEELGLKVTMTLASWSFPLAAGMIFVFALVTWIVVVWGIANGNVFYVCR